MEEEGPPPEHQQETDGLISGKDYKKWLQTRCEEWAAAEERKESWTSICTKKFQKVPQANHMSLVEMEETLIECGDAEVEDMKTKAEPLYDGTVDRFMRDNDGMHFAAFIQCKEAFGDQQVYCHKVHIQHIQSGDKVRFAVHFNNKKQPQVSFIDRLNNRASSPRGPGGKGGKGGGKGYAPYASPVFAGAPQGGVLVQLHDGTVVSGVPLRVAGAKGQGGKSSMVSAYSPAVVQVPMFRSKDGKGKGKSSRPPKPGKSVYIGQIARKSGDNGFIKCAETEALYGRDVYMWKTYFAQCNVGDWVRFNIHVSEKGLPQVSWLERLERIHTAPARSFAPFRGKK
jgi:hypothetical protein